MVSPLILDTRPRLDALIELDHDAQYELMLAPPNAAELARHGLAVYRERGAYLKLWLGLKDPAVPEHCRWLFHTRYLSAAAGSWWLACEPEDASELTDETVNVHGELQRLYTICQDMNRFLSLESLPQRDVAWLMTYRQVFGESNSVRISLMPQQPDWVALHELFYHAEAWRHTHDAENMPAELLLRMQGMGPYMDHEYGRSLINHLLGQDG